MPPDFRARGQVGPFSSARKPLRQGPAGQRIGRVDVSEPASISTGIARRYATAVFDLARDGDQLDALERDVDALDAALAQSADLRDLIRSPIYSRESQAAAVAAIAAKMGLTETVRNTLGLMARKRRLFVLPQMLRALTDMLAAHKGETTAEVTSAKALTKTQADKLSKTLKARMGSEVKIKSAVDESLIGGLVIKVGSTMIDTSIRSKLSQLQNKMKEVG